MGIPDADTAEDDPASRNPIIAPVACAAPNRQPGAPKLSGGLAVKILPGTNLSRIYGRQEAEEEYFCNYEVNRAYESRFESAGLIISARGPDGEVRAVELPGHRFFLGSLFQPHMASAAGKPHPLFVHFLQAAAAFQRGNRHE